MKWLDDWTNGMSMLRGNIMSKGRERADII
jgi:hypothetical protein